MRVLITGGAGFIGSHLAKMLVRLGYEVFVIDDLSGGRIENLDNMPVKFYEADLRNANLATKIINEIKPQVVYHLAADAAEHKSLFSPREVSTRSWNTFINILIPSINSGMRRFVFTSSIAVYGELQTPFREWDDPKPEDLYGVTKLMIEQSLSILSSIHNFEYVIVRPHNVYGPGQNMADPYRNVITIFMNALLSGKPLYIYGDGRQKRCFTFIEDIIFPLWKAGFLKGINRGVFNLGSDRSYTILELIKELGDIAQIKKSQIVFLPNRVREVTDVIPDHKKAKKFLGYKDFVSLREGLEMTWDYAKDIGYQDPKTQPLEIKSSFIPKNWEE